MRAMPRRDKSAHVIVVMRVTCDCRGIHANNGNRLTELFGQKRCDEMRATDRKYLIMRSA